MLVDDTAQGMISYQRTCFDVFWFVPVGEFVLLVLLFYCHCMMIRAAKFKKKFAGHMDVSRGPFSVLHGEKMK